MITSRKNSIKPVKYGFIGALDNVNYSGLVRNSISIFRDTELENSLLNKSFESLSFNSALLEELVRRSMEHPHTKEIDRLAEERLNALSSFRKIAEASINSVKEGHKSASAILTHWLRPHKRDLVNYSTSFQSNIIRNLELGYEKDAEIKESVQVLGLTEQFEHILTLTNEIESMIEERSVEMEALRKETKKARGIIYDDFKYFLSVLHNLAVDDQETEDPKYYTLYKNLSGIVAHHRHRYNLRKAERRNGNGVDDEKSDTSETNPNDSF